MDDQLDDVTCFFCREQRGLARLDHYGKLCSLHLAQYAVRARLYPTLKEEIARKAAQKKFNLKSL